MFLFPAFLARFKSRSFGIGRHAPHLGVLRARLKKECLGSVSFQVLDGVPCREAASAEKRFQHTELPLHLKWLVSLWLPLECQLSFHKFEKLSNKPSCTEGKIGNHSPNFYATGFKEMRANMEPTGAPPNEDSLFKCVLYEAAGE